MSRSDNFTVATRQQLAQTVQSICSSTSSAMRRRIRSLWSRDFRWRRKRSFSSRFFSPNILIWTKSVIILYHHFMNALSRALLLAVLFGGTFSAQSERPLTSLPYTPSLDTRFMDRTVKACVDFYRYACGNWSKLNPIPADQARWNVYDKLHDENLRFLWGLLEEAARSDPGRNSNQQKIGDYFQSCMDESAVERAAAAPLRKDLDAIAALRSREQLPA